MKQKEKKAWEDRFGMDTKDLLSLIDIVDDFPQFCRDLKDYITKHPTQKGLQTLQRACLGGFTISKDANDFCMKNKKAVDRLNEGSTVVFFRLKYFDEKGNPRSDKNEPFNVIGFYQYLISHKDEREEIRENVERMMDLGVETVKIDSSLTMDATPITFKTIAVRSLTEPLTLPEKEEIPTAFNHGVLTKGNRMKI